MNLFAKAGRWPRALQLLSSCGQQQIRPNERSLHACVAACEKAEKGEWQRALELVFGAMTMLISEMILEDDFLDLYFWDASHQI